MVKTADELVKKLRDDPELTLSMNAEGETVWGQRPALTSPIPENETLRCNVWYSKSGLTMDGLLVEVLTLNPGTTELQLLDMQARVTEGYFVLYVDESYELKLPKDVYYATHWGNPELRFETKSGGNGTLAVVRGRKSATNPTAKEVLEKLVRNPNMTVSCNQDREPVWEQKSARTNAIEWRRAIYRSEKGGYTTDELLWFVLQMNPLTTQLQVCEANGRSPYMVLYVDKKQTMLTVPEGICIRDNMLHIDKSMPHGIQIPIAIIEKI